MDATSHHLLLLLLTLSPFFHHISKLDAAENDLIEVVCRVAEAPESCIQCLRSDPHAEDDDKVGIATIMINCVSSHANSLSANMSNTAVGSQDEAAKKLFLECSKDYASAEKELDSGIISLKCGKYDDAQVSVALALKYDTDCHFKIISFKKKIAQQIVYKIKLFEQLCVAANRIIEHI
ncbi:hypothetical protein FNV43_RR21025 [Rhamnella rubrinervis]|uniref:Pectinesterase inhibitor domain-containing protein n=1 Tax=Rhamnella rubrinervis TaxID=2594499 RepID=A0A8K0GTZ4_9ROSA|nr:hypothetical protein FNV43_RR21025 [Rhamnella rubrinervis]